MSVEKDFPPLPKGDPVLDEKITLKPWSGGKFLDAQDDVKVMRFSTKDGSKVFMLGVIKGGKPTPKSLITDADGNTYEITKVNGGAAPYNCHVTLKKP